MSRTEDDTARCIGSLADERFGESFAVATFVAAYLPLAITGDSV